MHLAVATRRRVSYLPDDTNTPHMNNNELNVVIILSIFTITK